MKRRINAQLIGIAILSIVATTIFMSGIFYYIFKRQVQEDLRLNAEILRGLQDVAEESLALGDWEEEGLRVTWIGADGAVLFDNDANESAMENHAKRPEVLDAFLTGKGEAVRNSDTLQADTFYYAVLLEDGSVLRVAREAASLWSVFETAFPFILLVALVIGIVSALLARVLTRSLIRPIEKMAADLDDGTISPAYKELVPFANMIRSQHENILNAARMRQDFTANVSHELKTPLTAISGYAELIENHMIEGDAAAQSASEIRRNSERLLSLINDIIRLSELDGAERNVVFEQLDLYKLVEECAAALSVSAGKRNIDFSYSGESVMVNANHEMMVELIHNLCENAIRYNNEGGNVEVCVKQKDGRAVLSVSDNGIGIPKDQQERIFERFYRVDKSRSKKTGGTGLGLAIVKHIVVIHNAELLLESEPGKGTTICVYL